MKGDNMKGDVGNFDKFLDNKSTGSLQRYKDFYGTSHNNNAHVPQHSQSSKRLIDHCTGVSGITGPQNCKQLIGSLIHFLIEWEVCRYFDEKEVNMWSVVFSGKHKGRESTAYEVDDSDIAWAYHFVGQYWSEKNDTTPTLDNMMAAASRIQHVVGIIHAAYNLYTSNFRGPITQDERGLRPLGPSQNMETQHVTRTEQLLESNPPEKTTNSNGLSTDLLFGYTGDEAQMTQDSSTSVEALHMLHSACAIEIKTTTHRPWQETKEHWAELRTIYRKAIKPYRQNGFQGVVFVIIIVYPFAEVIVFQWVNYKSAYITAEDVPIPRLQLTNTENVNNVNHSHLWSHQALTQSITALYEKEIEGNQLYPEHTIGTLIQRIHALHLQHDTLQSEKIGLEHSINDLKRNMGGLKHSMSTAENTISQLKEEINTLNKTNDTLTQRPPKHSIIDHAESAGESTKQTTTPKKPRLTVDKRWSTLEELTLHKLYELTAQKLGSIPKTVWIWKTEAQSKTKRDLVPIFADNIEIVFKEFM